MLFLLYREHAPGKESAQPRLTRSVRAELELRRASAIDPNNVSAHMFLGQMLAALGRASEAEPEWRAALEIDPDHVQSLFAYAMTASQCGKVDEAVSMAERAVVSGGRSPFFLGTLGLMLGLAGRREEAEAVARELDARARHESVLPMVRAWVALGLGQHGRALDLLEQAFAERNAMLFTLKAMEIFEPLRGETRFAQLVRKVGLA
jgi:Flp pilus assembly protein TadD